MRRATGLAVLVLAGALPPPVQAAACDNGTSGGFACSHVELAGHLSSAELGGDGEVLNDIWGWVDPLEGEAYALVGMENGTAFVRIADDGTPEYLGRLVASDGQSPVWKTGGAHGKSCHDELCGGEASTWRDIKVYGNYAYIVSEAPGHGVQIFDLTRLRALDGAAPQVFTEAEANGFYEGIGHAHNIFINEASARAYVVGHDNSAMNRAGGLHILDLGNPLAPVLIGEVNGDGYTHDVQCVIYKGPDDVPANSEICFASNEDTLTIWDVTDASNAVMRSKHFYSDAAYTHQGWLSDDQRHFFLNDELDERASGTRTRLRVFDVSDLDAPELAAEYLAPTLSIDHNNYVHGRWLYQSNYGAGLRILDILDPLHPVEAGYFDSQAADHANFFGTWSNYRFPDGLTVISDIGDGLYVLRPTLATSGIAPDIGVTMTLATAEAEAGNPVHGEFIVGAGPAADASDVLVTLHLPAGAAFEAVNAPQGWNCRDSGQGRVTECRSVLVAAGDGGRFAFTLVPEAAGAVKVIGMAYANAADAAPSDNLAAGDVTVKPVSLPPAPSGDRSGGGAIGLLAMAILASSALRLRSGRSRR